TDEFESTRCESPEAAARLFIASSPDDGREHFRALFLSARNIPLAIHTVSVGCMTQAVVHPRLCAAAHNRGYVAAAVMLRRVAIVLACPKFPLR
ncbi:MAG TPA: hypothetical protein ENO14_03495, partial [Chromatiales bacterium]|nr:hypothetical protein [Chromatiales bacterium]